MTNGEKGRSVRVDIDDGFIDRVDVPDATGGSGGPQSWVIIAAVVAVGAIVAAVLLLRPAADEAADGSIREAPATTVPGTDDGEAADGESTDEAKAGEVRATRLAIAEPITGMISTDTGYLALGSSPSPTPELFRSVDGQNWTVVTTTLDTASGRNAIVPPFRGLSRFGDQLVVTSLIRDQAAPVELLVLVSDVGDSWVEFELPGTTISDAQEEFSPTNFSEDSIWGFQFAGSPIVEEFLMESTSIENVSDGVCGFERDSSEASDLPTIVLDCLGEEIGSIDESTVRPGLTSAVVADCARLLFRTGGPASSSFDLIRQRLGTIDGFESVGEASRRLPPVNFGAVTLVSAPVDLPGGGIAVFDAGQPPFDMPTRCVGLVDQPDVVSPSVVVATAGSGELQRIPAEDDSGEAISILGEESVTGTDQIVVVRDRALWALDRESGDPQSGQWEGPLTGPRMPFPGGVQRIPKLSESGTRAYAVDEGSLVTFDFVADSSGALDVSVTTQPIDFDVAPGDIGEFITIVHADDELVFIEALETVWSLPAPPRQGE